MVSYTLPGMTEFPNLNLLFLSFYRDARDIFFDDVAIESVYGGFPGSPLCGGRNNLGETISLGDVEKCLARYRNLGVACNVHVHQPARNVRRNRARRVRQAYPSCSMSNRPTATCRTG